MEDKLLQIINYYSVSNQQRKLAEEVFELQEAIFCCENDECNYYDEVFKNNKKHITEELADVMVMLMQFKEYYNINGKEIMNIIEYKINRQIDRIAKEKE